MRVIATADETYCLKTQSHTNFCTGINHICYRCGMLRGPCHHRKLGTLLDY
ncbi:MAG: hypothetical protein HY296_04090 [Thaumarchaeota archaeon]|nr:hypothetical protein [Nitrososphaerota archaeon]